MYFRNTCRFHFFGITISLGSGNKTAARRSVSMETKQISAPYCFSTRTCRAFAFAALERTASREEYLCLMSEMIHKDHEARLGRRMLSRHAGGPGWPVTWPGTVPENQQVRFGLVAGRAVSPVLAPHALSSIGASMILNASALLRIYRLCFKYSALTVRIGRRLRGVCVCCARFVVTPRVLQPSPFTRGIAVAI